MGFWDRFSTDIGIDLGTCNTLIYVRGRGIVINEPSVIAVERGTNQVVAVGAEAKRMLFKTPGNIIAIRPLADGVISDIDSTEKMIRYFISKIIPRRQLIKSTRMKIGIPTCITEVERRAVLEAALKAGAKEVDVIAESLAAAIGADIPIHEPAGHMVCDIGGGTTEVSVISLGGMVVTKAIRTAGDEFDEAIIKYIKGTHNLVIGPETAERIKMEIGNVAPDRAVGKMGIMGRDAMSGLPRKIDTDSNEVRDALKDPITEIIDAIKNVLGETPPELAADIFERGIVMTGGGSLLKGLDKLIQKETGVPVILIENPLECVAVGAGKAFELFRDMSSDRSIYNNLSS
jgi:rod shape-determining protein MreB